LIAFYSDRSQPSGIHTMEQDGDNVLPVTTMGDADPDWQPLVHQGVWGDNNCSGNADPVDALFTLRYDAGLPTETGECPEMGEEVAILTIPNLWGDLDCSDAIDPVDGLKLLRLDAGLDVARPPACPDPGQSVVLL
jgi:hypothetical protein